MPTSCQSSQLNTFSLSSRRKRKSHSQNKLNWEIRDVLTQTYELTLHLIKIKNAIKFYNNNSLSQFIEVQIITKLDN